MRVREVKVDTKNEDKVEPNKYPLTHRVKRYCSTT